MAHLGPCHLTDIKELIIPSHGDPMMFVRNLFREKSTRECKQFRADIPALAVREFSGLPAMKYMHNLALFCWHSIGSSSTAAGAPGSDGMRR